jgi:hypothetical protein
VMQEFFLRGSYRKYEKWCGRNDTCITVVQCLNVATML